MDTPKSNRPYTLIIVALLAAAAYFLLQGSPLFPKDQEFTGLFDDVNGLAEGAPVMAKGVQVGKVSELYQENRQIRVDFYVDHKMEVPEGTVVRLESSGMNGEKNLRLDLGTGPRLLPSGHQMATAVDTTMFDNLKTNLTPMLADTRVLIKAADSSLSAFNYMVWTGLPDRLMRRQQAASREFTGIMRQSQRINQGSIAFSKTLRNIESGSASFEAKNEQISRELSDAAAKTRQIAEKDPGAAISRVAGQARKARDFSSKLNTDEPGSFIADPAAYKSISGSLDTLNQSLKDLRENGSGFSLFGKKKK